MYDNVLCSLDVSLTFLRTFHDIEIEREAPRRNSVLLLFNAGRGGGVSLVSLKIVSEASHGNHSGQLFVG